MEIQERSFKVVGMTCENCVARIAKTVEQLLGVLNARGDLALGTFLVSYDPAQVTPEAIVRAIRHASETSSWEHTYDAEILKD